MAKTHEVQGIDHLPVYLISPDDPWEIAEEDFIDGLPLVDVLNRMATGDHLYFVDFSSVLGHTKLTRLVCSAGGTPSASSARARQVSLSAANPVNTSR